MAQYERPADFLEDFGQETSWRFIAQNALTKEWLHWDLPLVREEQRTDLTGPGALRGSISPVRPELIDAAGEFLLREWQTAIYAEADGEIRWGGLVTRLTWSGPTVNVECAGFSTYPHGYEYDGPLYSKLKHNPVQVVVDVWAYLQGQPDGNLDLRVVRPEDEPPSTLGKPGAAEYTEYQLDGTWTRTPPAGSIVTAKTGTLAVAMKATGNLLTLRKLADFDKLKLPYTVRVGSEDLRVTARSGLKLTVTRGYGSTNAGPHSTGTLVKFTAGTPSRKVEAVEAEPYVLAWWENTDLGQEIDQLASTTPFDYVERHYWDPDAPQTVVHELVLGHPRLGRRQDSLAFVQGENITDLVEATRNGDTYANVMRGLGKGEGDKTVRTTVAVRDGRLRRPGTWVDKTTADKTRLTARARTELERRKLLVSFSTITVRDHDNARLGSFGPGDDIPVTVDLDWLGRVVIWHRITALALVGENAATLTLARSDSFSYAAATVDA